MAANAKSLKRLIGLQQLAKAKLDMAISSQTAQIEGFRQEDRALFAMQDRQFDTSAPMVDPALVIARLGRNSVQQMVIEKSLVVQRQQHLQLSRRLDILADRLAEHEQQTMRAQDVALIEEFVGGHGISLSD